MQTVVLISVVFRLCTDEGLLQETITRVYRHGPHTGERKEQQREDNSPRTAGGFERELLYI